MVPHDLAFRDDSRGWVMPKPGYRQTPEHRAAISAGVRGREISAESRERMRSAHLGKVFSPAAREKMAAAKRGKKQTAELIERRVAGRRMAAEQRAASKMRLAIASAVQSPQRGRRTHDEVMQTAHDLWNRTLATMEANHIARAKLRAEVSSARSHLIAAKERLARLRGATPQAGAGSPI